ncbi:hypothetical protein TBR22_A19700 [Luteitalea sp. TBR-22]|uniref:hypothetical protein n=1 Tax=Luteitalea sp. TBR-22 TaxID=2802971 RepID=UPI001AF9DCDD|nr:hypothetical protein [Luteitalea sp. TBR-22]BCS32748.1 hypothetical protein TBR22_A19700 [Luteitalea sp. TBR-22]
MFDVYLIPIAAGRLEPYCEPAEDAEPLEPDVERGLFRRLADRFRHMLAEAEQERRRRARGEDLPDAPTWWGRLQQRTLRGAAEHINEQRLLWHLRKHTQARLHHPDDVPGEQALQVMRTSLRKDGDRHLLWLVTTTILFVASGALALLPGPNVLAYFLGFFVVARYLSWRGARHGLRAVIWHMAPTPALSELRGALDLPGDAREPIVLDIAMRLRLEDLPLFVARMVPARA